MVLKTGGPCIAMKKDKEATAAQTLLAAVMVACGNTDSHAWYAGPLCKGCYERDLTKKRKQTSAMNGVPMDAQSEEMQETLVAIEEVYASRCTHLHSNH